MTGVRAFIARATYSLDALHWTHFLVIESDARLVWCDDLISWEPIERHSCTQAFECTWRGPAVQSRAARALQSEPLCCSRECHVKCLSALESMFTCVRIALPSRATRDWWKSESESVQDSRHPRLAPPAPSPSACECRVARDARSPHSRPDTRHSTRHSTSCSLGVRALAHSPAALATRNRDSELSSGRSLTHWRWRWRWHWAEQRMRATRRRTMLCALRCAALLSFTWRSIRIESNGMPSCHVSPVAGAVAPVIKFTRILFLNRTVLLCFALLCSALCLCSTCTRRPADVRTNNAHTTES